MGMYLAPSHRSLAWQHRADSQHDSSPTEHAVCAVPWAAKEERAAVAALEISISPEQLSRASELRASLKQRRDMASLALLHTGWGRSSVGGIARVRPFALWEFMERWASSYDTKENFLPHETKNSFSKVLNLSFTFISQWVWSNYKAFRVCISFHFLICHAFCYVS